MLNSELAPLYVVTAKLRRETLAGVKLAAKVVLGAPERVGLIVDGRARWVERPSARVVFSGGQHGEHSIDAYVSDAARVLAHWLGYIEANGLKSPVVGQWVKFPSASAWQVGGFRKGRVLSVGPKRAKIAFQYKHGGKAVTTIAIDRLRFG